MKKLIVLFTAVFLMMGNMLFAQQDGVIDDPGDIAFVAYHDSPDGFSFVFLDDCPAGTVIQFTDKEWTGTVFTTGEGVDVWTNNTGGTIAQGTVVHVENAHNNPITSVGVTSEDESGFGTGTGIDQIYAVIGGTISGSDFLTPSAFLAFVGELNGGGTNNAVLTNTGLVLGTHAVDLGPGEGYYSGSTDCNGTLTDCLQMLNDLTNWTMGGFSFPTVVPGSFGGSALSSCDLLITTCPPNPATINGCTGADVSSVLPFSTSAATITEAQFITEGGAITTTASISSITYQDVAVGLLPTTVTRTFTVMDNCPATTTCTQVFTIDDDTAPTADVLAAVNVQCIAGIPAANVNDVTGETDNCNIVCEVWINEFHYDNTGSDINEFVEVAGLTGTNLSVYDLVLYNGNGGNPYFTINLTGTIDAESTGFGAVSFTHVGIQNGSPDGIALVKNGTEVIEFLSYEGSFSASSGPAAGMTSVDVGVTEPGTTAVGASIERIGTGNMGTNFVWGSGTESPGSLNAGQTMTACTNVVVSYVGETNNAGAGSTASPYVVTRSYKLTDPSGNMATITQMLTAIDNTPPSSPCPGTMNVNNDPGICGAVVNFPATGPDNCGTATISYSPSSGSVFAAGSTPVTATATDALGNQTTCTFNVIVADNTPPVANCHAGVAVQLDVNGNASITGSDINNGSFDLCSGIASLSVSPSSFTCAQAGLNVGATLTVTDGSGNFATCLTTVAVNDAILPTAICKNIIVQLNASGVATITGADINNGSTDNCGIPTASSVTPNTFNCSNIDITNTVTLTVTDGSGNTNTCTAEVTVQDNVPPVALCKTGVVAQLNANGVATITGTDIDNGSNDACSGIASLSVSPNVFTCVQEGSNIPVTLTVTDGKGNVSTCTTTVNVNDAIPPMASCMNITVQLDANGMATITEDDIESGSTDNCGVANALSVTPNTFNCTNVGLNNVVTVTVGDGNGNQNTCTAIVTVQDNVLPMALCKTGVIAALDANGMASITVADVDAGSSDNCNIAFMSVSPSTFNCAQEGANVPVTLTVTDVNGNVSTCITTVNVDDAIPPTASCMNITVQLDGNGMASITPDDVENGSTDNCGTTVALSVTPNTFDCSNVQLYINAVTVTVGDGNGNQSTCTALVMVEDNQPAQAVCAPATLNLTSDGTTILDPSNVDGGSYSVCGSVTLSVSPNGFTCDDIGPQTVTLTATDASNGNSTTCTTTVTVADPSSFCCAGPTISCPTGDVDVALDANGLHEFDYAATLISYTAECGLESIVFSRTVFSCIDAINGSTTVTATVTDINGETASCDFTVRVRDNIPPVVSCPTAISQNNDAGVCGAVVTYDAPTATDNCAFETTPLDVGTSNQDLEEGFMMDISVPATGARVQLSKIRFRTADTGDDYLIEVYYKIGTNTGFLNDASAWTFVGTQSFPNAAATLMVDLPGININPGETVALYVVNLLGDEDLYTFDPSSTPVTDGNISISNSLEVNTSIGGSGAFDNNSDNGNEYFSGVIEYYLSTGTPTLSSGLASGITFPVGTTNVVYSVTDIFGNSNSCNFDVTIADTEAPTIDTPCPATIALCGAQNVSWTAPTAMDNCGITSTISSHDSGDYFNVGTTTVTYTFYDAAGLSVSCSFDVTIHPLPEIMISTSNLPAFCQGVQVLNVRILNEGDLTPPFTYAWSNGLGTAPQAIAADNNTTYSLTLTDGNGCSGVASYYLSVDLTNLLSAHVIVANDELEMSESEVFGGGVGLFDADEDVKIVNNSTIHTFLESSEVYIDGSSSVADYIDGSSSLGLPAFSYNNFNDYNHVTVPAGTTTTLSGNRYGIITVMSNATLIFNNPSVFVKKIVTKTGATISFNQATNLMLRRSLSIGQNNSINASAEDVVIYVGDDVSVKQGSYVIADMYVQEGIEVNESRDRMTTYMIGLFIANDGVESGDEVIWDWNFGCNAIAPPPAPNPQLAAPINTGNVTPASVGKDLAIYPNPTTGSFTMDVLDFMDKTIDISIYNSLGKVVWQQHVDKLDLTLLKVDLSNAQFSNGIYYVSVNSGDEIKTKSLVLNK